MRCWYVAYTRAGMERMAQGHLENQGFATYLPRRRKSRRHARRVESVLVPLFPRYLFVALDLAVDRWRAVNGTYGIAGLVGMGERPSVAPADVIDEIRAREDADGIIDIEEPPPFAPGEVVEITRGALARQCGIFKCGDDRQRVTLLLSLLGRKTEIRLPGDAVRAIA